ncbi:MAG: hypothetical protein ABEI53_03215, partial [Candidatus Magasanikbacteria bacterium]
MTLIFKLSILAILIVSAVAGFFWWKRRRRLSVRQKLKRKLLLVRLADFQEDKDSNPVQEISKMESLFNTVAKFEEPIVFEAAVSYLEEEIAFYVSVPTEYLEPFISQVHSLWERSLVEEVGDYNAFNSEGASLVGEVSQEDNFSIPIKTYENLESDTFTPILGGLSNLEDLGEAGSLQVIIKPATNQYKGKINRDLKDLREGESIRSESGFVNFIVSAVESFFSVLAYIFKAFHSHPKKKKNNKD